MADTTLTTEMVNATTVLITQQTTQFEQLQKTLETLSDELKAIKELPTFKSAMSKLNADMSAINSAIQQCLDDLNKKDTELKSLKTALAAQYEILATKEDEKKGTEAQLKQYIAMYFQAENLAANSGEFNFVKMARNDVHNLVGTGMDIILDEHMRIADVQAYSFEQQLAEIKSDLEKIQAETKAGEAQTHANLEIIESWLQEQSMTNIMNIGKQVDAVTKNIAELKQLQSVYESDTLAGAAARDERAKLISALTKYNPNAVDETGHKPIYYAARLGAINTFLVLCECTKLDKKEKVALLEVFPKDEVDPKEGELPEKYNLAASKLNDPKTRYDYLWNQPQNVTIIDKMTALFKDYYSPNIFSNITMLSDDQKRILTGNWGREVDDLKLAEGAVQIMSHLTQKEKEKKPKTWKILFEGRWDSYFNKHQLSSDDELAKRLHYINLKLSWNLGYMPQMSDSPFAAKKQSPAQDQRQELVEDIIPELQRRQFP